VVEAVADTPAPFFQIVAERLASAELVPIFAHPERARAVQRDIGVLADARRLGALVQVVAPSLLGRWGRPTAGAAWKLIDRGLADLVGSDAHGLRSRRPHLREVMTEVTRRAGRERAAQLTLHAPRRLLGESRADR
jgi:protein-tyrosine phosphatase